MIPSNNDKLWSGARAPVRHGYAQSAFHWQQRVAHSMPEHVGIDAFADPARAA